MQDVELAEGESLEGRTLTQREVVSFERKRVVKLTLVGGSGSRGATSEVIPGVYEGGAKVWECAWDLIRLVTDIEWTGDGTDPQRLAVLELGCGHGLPGIAMRRLGIAKSVTFQDLNAEVLTSITIPNFIANDDAAGRRESCSASFIAGPWEALPEHFEKRGGRKFDCILSSEGAYRSETYEALCCILESSLATNGKALFAMKRLYFGLSGGTSDFVSFVNSRRSTSRDKSLAASVLWSSADGKTNIRDVVSVCWRNSSSLLE